MQTRSNIKANNCSIKLQQYNKPTRSLRIKTCYRKQDCKEKSTNRQVLWPGLTQRCSRTMWINQKPQSYASRLRLSRRSWGRRRSIFSNRRRKLESLTSFERPTKTLPFWGIGCWISSINGRLGVEKPLSRHLPLMKLTGSHSSSNTERSYMTQMERRVASKAIMIKTLTTVSA